MLQAMTDTPADSIYLVAAHPDWRNSRITRRLLDAARSMPSVDVNDLYTSYPDYALDVQAEQTRLQRASLVALMFPLYWYSAPALLKLWLDEVLTYGWAYGQSQCALAGKTLWLVTSGGGPEASYQPSGYNRHRLDEFLIPWQQMAHLCAMNYAPPLTLLGARSASEATLDTHVNAFTQALNTWPQWATHQTANTDASAPEGVWVPATDRQAASA